VSRIELLLLKLYFTEKGETGPAVKATNRLHCHVVKRVELDVTVN
jgi:hypothetical protein